MAEQCAACRTPGQAVAMSLVRHHVVEPWRGQLEGKEFSFCASTDCDVMYFSVSGESYRTGDVRRAPAYKTGHGSDLLCFCFDVSGDAAMGEPDPTPYTRERVRRGECACNVLNPSGCCCLGSIGRWKKGPSDSN